MLAAAAVVVEVVIVRCVVDGAFSDAIVVHLPRGDLRTNGVKPEKKALRMET